MLQKKGEGPGKNSENGTFRPPDENKFMPEISQKRIFWQGNWISKLNMGGEREKTCDLLA